MKETKEDNENGEGEGKQGGTRLRADEPLIVEVSDPRVPIVLAFLGRIIRCGVDGEGPSPIVHCDVGGVDGDNGAVGHDQGRLVVIAGLGNKSGSGR